MRLLPFNRWTLADVDPPWDGKSLYEILELNGPDATSRGWEIRPRGWRQAPQTIRLLARLAYQRSKSGLIVRSRPATNTQLGFVRQAAVVIVAEKSSAKLKTCERAMNAACSAETSAANNVRNWVGSMKVKPSGVFFIVEDLARSLGYRLPSSDSFSQRPAYESRCTPDRQPRGHLLLL